MPEYPMSNKEYPRYSLALAGAIGALVGLTAEAAVNQKTAPPLNVVIILADNLGWTDLACYGSALHESPHLDPVCPLESEVHQCVCRGEHLFADAGVADDRQVPGPAAHSGALPQRFSSRIVGTGAGRRLTSATCRIWNMVAKANT